ncbi:MAG TPA: Holliday junction resolvase RuvX [Candidatus Saccharimonadia bacterium]|nr:Holliday junction resolvase RuvX [Candidatus Saccharimonadia bacterium]
MAKYLGIDYGTKRVGLATADADAKVATPLTAVAPHELAVAIEREGPFEAVVVGLPRGLDGQDTPQTLAVRRFSDDVLWRRLHLEPVFQDEAGTSALAEDRLKESGKPYNKGDIDSAAAALILQDYLDTL